MCLPASVLRNIVGGANESRGSRVSLVSYSVLYLSPL